MPFLFMDTLEGKRGEQKKTQALDLKEQGKLFSSAEDKYLLLCPDRDRAAQHLIKCLFNWLVVLYTVKTLL